VLTWITLNNLKFTKMGFSEFLRFSAATLILKARCAEMVDDRPGQPAYDILSIKNLSFDI